MQGVDQAAGKRKQTKAISFPEMDDDALPSSYALKVLSAIGKWQLKMDDLVDNLDKKNSTMKEWLGCIQYWVAHIAKHGCQFRKCAYRCVVAARGIKLDHVLQACR